ncbi:deoxyguanosinetriphosphate triphosphohydrolase [Bacillus pumilus]|uniref:Deoxyguanosinetriphosphate triphosphohydrolase n=1 Tax=Bacillus pumilus TaxID=1408 RepID=A0A2A5J2P7_BACPU|nr:YbaK family protein [Bacillus pumilus]PCK23517.1 deoxyguanosinetriphosphate triphosphohydrolase [Bacillus pumilus]
MAEVLSFYQLKTKRDVTLEKKLLRTLSLQRVTVASEKLTKNLFPFADDPAGIMSDGCIDFAIEAFLAGGRYGESRKNGESFDDMKKRSFQEENDLIEELAGCLQSWGNMFRMEQTMSSLYPFAKDFLSMWWQEGFRESEKRHKLRLH